MLDPKRLTPLTNVCAIASFGEPDIFISWRGEVEENRPRVVDSVAAKLAPISLWAVGKYLKQEIQYELPGRTHLLQTPEQKQVFVRWRFGGVLQLSGC